MGLSFLLGTRVWSQNTTITHLIPQLFPSRSNSNLANAVISSHCLVSTSSMPFFELAADWTWSTNFSAAFWACEMEELEVGPYMAGMWWCVDWAIQYLPADLLFNHSLFGQGMERRTLSSSSQVLVDELMRANGTNKDCLPALAQGCDNRRSHHWEDEELEERKALENFWVNLSVQRAHLLGC